MGARMWDELFKEVMDFSDGNILVHCNEGYHRAPAVAGMVWCSTKNAQADSQSEVKSME